MRFQPRHGRYLAAAAENVVSILDVETQACRHSLQVSIFFNVIIQFNQGQYEKMPTKKVSFFFQRKKKEKANDTSRTFIKSVILLPFFFNLI